MIPVGERIARLEASMEHLEERIDGLVDALKEHRTESIDNLKKMREENADSFKKIREDISGLLELKQRGQGAFWLVMSIVGSGFLGAGFGLWELFKGSVNHG